MLCSQDSASGNSERELNCWQLSSDEKALPSRVGLLEPSLRNVPTREEALPFLYATRRVALLRLDWVVMLIAIRSREQTRSSRRIAEFNSHTVTTREEALPLLYAIRRVALLRLDWVLTLIVMRSQGQALTSEGL